MWASFFLCCAVLGLSEAGVLSRPRRSTTCYGGECFSNAAPFNNTDGLLPQSPAVVQTTFRLFTQQRRLNPSILTVGDVTALQRSGFDPQLPTRVIIHGFLQHAQVSWVRTLAGELLKLGPMNVITVDWGHGSGFPYSQASANTRLVGYQLSQLIAFLKYRTGVSSSSVHLIGHSLGAHVAGYAGKRTPGLGRISGLDPAQPDFDGTDPAVRLDPTDAAFVDVIHTDGSEFDYVSGFGMMTAVGHIDFYPNGGENQPGCPVENVENIMSAAYRRGLEDAEDMLSCSHSRSIYLYTESVRSSCQFQAYRCPSLADMDTNRADCMQCGPQGCPVMGFHADSKPNLTGSYYLRTRDSAPYCGYSQHVDVLFGTRMTSSSGTIRVELVADDQSSDNIHIDSGNAPFHAGQHRDVLGVESKRMDDIRQIRVTYRQSSSSGSWWRSSFNTTPHAVSVAMVTVTSPRSGRRVFFCGDDQPVPNGMTITLTRSSTDPQACRAPPPPDTFLL